MSRTKIEWVQGTDGVKGLTINPIVGCSKISEGCQNCYAEKMAWRLKCMGIPKYQDVVDRNGWTGKIGVDMSVFNNLPEKPKKIFVGSMGDLFHDNVPTYKTYGHIFDRAYMSNYKKGMKLKEPSIFIFLTKRPINMLKKIEYYQHRYGGNMPSNIWLGVTAENQKRADERIPILLQIPAAKRFVSVEPMLDFISIKHLLNLKEPTFKTGIVGADCFGYQNKRCISWVIAGPETGPGKRECKPGWIRDLYEQCQAAGVPFFDKRKKNWIAREFPNTESQ